MYHLFSPLLAAASGSSFSSWVDGINGDGKVVLLLSLVGALIAITAISVQLFDRIHRRNAEVQLKRDMLERGLSVDEMERVLSMKATNMK